jgi:hypothetical protein
MERNLKRNAKDGNLLHTFVVYSMKSLAELEIRGVIANPCAPLYLRQLLRLTLQVAVSVHGDCSFDGPKGFGECHDVAKPFGLENGA